MKYESIDSLSELVGSMMTYLNAANQPYIDTPVLYTWISGSDLNLFRVDECDICISRTWSIRTGTMFTDPATYFLREPNRNNFGEYNILTGYMLQMFNPTDDIWKGW